LGKEVIERAKGNSVSTELFITQAQYQEIKRKFGSPHDGDILLTSVGTLGVAYFIDGDGDFYFKDGNVTWFRNFDPRVVPKYLYYWLTSPETQKRLDEVSIGSTQRALTISALKSLQVQLPSVDSQKAIVDMLDAVTNRIALLRETNATLEAIAQALFKSWFVDFDPVRAKMEGRTPDGMDEATAALFPDGFETLELGDVPRGWMYCSLKEVCSIFDSKRVPLSGAERAKRRGPYPYYGAAALMDHVNGYLFDGIYLLTGEDGSVADEQGFPITQYVWGRFWVNNHAHILQGKAGFSTEHLALALRRVNIQPYITGAVQAKLSQSNMWRINVLHPGQDVAEAFGDLIAPLYESVRANVEQAQTLSTLRDTLLPRLISGQLRLPEAKSEIMWAIG
jgi:restriction endonuclease S subunit